MHYIFIELSYIISCKVIYLNFLYILFFSANKNNPTVENLVQNCELLVYCVIKKFYTDSNSSICHEEI